EPKRLTALLRGELDWIVMKALEKDRNRRYETANGFAADVLRYLAGEPVLAVPPSAGYRLRKFLRRNKGPVLAVAVVFAVIVAGVIGTTWQAILAEQARGIADENAQKAKEEAANAARATGVAQAATARTNATFDSTVDDLVGADVVATFGPKAEPFL